MISNNKISNLVATQVPFFVRNDHENFVAFLEAYYEWLEQSNNTVNIAKSMRQQLDVDSADLFIENFYNNFLPLIPKNAVVDKTMVLKHIKDFYKARGSEKSIEFLMRILFNEDVNFYYPQKDILRASAGKWYIEKSLKIDNISVDGEANTHTSIIDKFTGRKIIGQTSNASALVESVDSYFEGGSLVRELKISGQLREFEPGETIAATFIENGQIKNITANTFAGGINTVELTNAGAGYNVGDTIIVESNTGNGAIVVVSSVTSGNLTTIGVVDGGAGFQVGFPVLVTGGGGSGANVGIIDVDNSGFYHPNSYNVVSTTIADAATVTLNSVSYANLNSANINTPIINAVNTFVYANTGPIRQVFMYNRGENYLTAPVISAQANSRIRSLGILGKMKIVNGGQNYVIGDKIEFINNYGSYGTGAAGRVRNVNTSSSNTITEVEFVNVPGQITGGSGYDQFNLPRANVISATGTNANIIVETTLGFGETLIPVGSSAGSIERLTIQSRGAGYDTAPTLNLSSIGDGTAQAFATIITGSYTYPGRYLNDDGHLSSYNFIQNRDYYQPFSYVLKIKQSVEKYRQAIRTLVHPLGMKMFGEYSFFDEGETLNVGLTSANDTRSIITLRQYSYNNSNLTINYTSHGLSVNNTVYLEWLTGALNTSSTIEGPYKVKSVVNANAFIVYSNVAASVTTATGNVNVTKLIV